MPSNPKIPLGLFPSFRILAHDAFGERANGTISDGDKERLGVLLARQVLESSCQLVPSDSNL